MKLTFGAGFSVLVLVLFKEASLGRPADVCPSLLPTSPHHNYLLSYSSACWNQGWHGTIKQSAGVFGRGWDVNTHAAERPAGPFHLSLLVGLFAWVTPNVGGS